MKDELRKHLHDIREAALAIKTFVAEKEFDDYANDELLRSAVERKFEIIGEALIRIRKEDPGVLDRFHNHRAIISFRNILIHAYDSIDVRIVWGIIEDDLDRLLEDVNRLLR